MSVGIYFISSKINRLSDAEASQQSDLSSFVQQHISGIRVLHRTTESLKLHRDLKESDKYKEKALDLVKVESTFIPLVILLVDLAPYLLSMWAEWFINGKLELGTFFNSFSM